MKKTVSTIKPKKVKHKILLNNIKLKKEDISDRIITISAQQRAGKSSLIVDFIRQFFKYQNKERTKETNKFIDELNLTGCYNLSKSKQGHYIFTAQPFSFYLDKKMTKKTYSVDPKRIGLPDDNNSFDFIPYGSIIIVDEADEIWPNREWYDTPKEVIDLLKYIGHNHLTLILICQVYGNLDKKFRELTMEHYHVLGRIVKPKFLFKHEKYIWYFDKTFPQEILMAQELSGLEIDVKPRIELGVC